MWRLILTLVTVSARNVDPDYIRDHYLAQPKTDFGSFDLFGLNREGVSGVTKFQGSLGERHFDRPVHDHRSFSTEFNRRQFYHSSNGDGNSRGFGENHNFGSSFHERDSRRSGHNFGSTSQSGFFERGEKHQTDSKERSHSIETLDHELGSELSTSETKIHDRSISNHNYRNTDSNSNHKFGFQEFQRNFGSDFSSQGYQSRIAENHEKSHKFNQNSEVQKRNDEQSEKYNSESGSHDRVGDGDKLSGASSNRKEEFEIILTNKTRNSNQVKENLEISSNLRNEQNNSIHEIRSNLRTNIQNMNVTNSSESPNILGNINYNHNIENDTTVISSSLNNKQNVNNQHEIRDNLKTDIRNVDTSNMTESSKKIQGTSTQNRDENVQMTQRQYNSANARNNQRTDHKTTTDNEIVTRTNHNKKNKTNGREVDDDRWIWNVTTTTDSAVDLDNRAAFNGDKCATGKIKVGTICVDVD